MDLIIQSKEIGKVIPEEIMFELAINFSMTSFTRLTFKKWFWMGIILRSVNISRCPFLYL